MKKKIISILGLSVLGLANANEKTGELKSSATMQATCSISVNPIGFGAVATPLLAQSAQSEMNVKCSNASAYNIELAYGGIYGEGSSPTDFSLVYSQASGQYSHNEYIIFNSSKQSIGSLYCGISINAGKFTFSNITAANIYGSNVVGSWSSNNTTKICTGDGTRAGTTPTGWIGAYNLQTYQPIGGSGYTYGVMQGSFKGDKLAYSIAVPGEPTKVWNAGNNSYKSTGNGDFQIIPVVAKIVPDKSGSKYPAPDMYLDTITAVISY